jgi:serine/threonine protein kinase
LPELIRLIGRGSYGEVWLARMTDSSLCATKIVRRESFNDERPYEREFNGIQKFAPLSRSYDSQLRILQVGRDDRNGFFFYVMELADDQQSGRAIVPEQYAPRTLRSEMRRQERLPLDECIGIGMTLSAALENLHQNGLIHRDIKPSNVIFVEGVPKLADIGLVTDLDMTVSYVGTEGFVPPEGPGSPRADIYSLGKVLFEISTGQDRQSFPELPTALADSPDAKRFLELNAIVARCCHPDPRRRYASARELYSDLAKLRRGRSIRFNRAVRKNVKVALWTAAAVTACFGLAALGITFFTRNGPETRLLIVKGKSNPLKIPHTPEPNPDPASRRILNLPPRSPLATSNQLDLTAFYNARLDSAWHNREEPRLNLARFPAGLFRVDDTSFDARGIIQLSGIQPQLQQFSYPQQVLGIPVSMKARRLRFLHSAVWSAREGAHLGDYVVHFADQQQHIFPIIYGTDLRDWNVGSDPGQRVTRGAVAWSSWQNPFAFRLYQTTWTNPTPSVEITKIDLISRTDSSAPFVVAITIE